MNAIPSLYNGAMRFIATALIALGTLVPSFALAQSVNLGSVGTAALTLDVSPQYPRPYDTVTVAPASTSFDLSGATVTVSVNGKEVAETTGTAATAITLGAPGTATTIKVSAVAGGQTYTATQVIRPAEVDLVTEPSATSHPFYQGGVGVASEGQVRLVAIADLRSGSGKMLDPASLIYEWKFNGQEVSDASGIGKSVFLVSAPIRYRSATVILTVSSQDQSVVGSASTVLSPVDPVLRIYENDPLLGVRYDQALPADYTLPGDEDSFEAVPYFFASAPGFTWTVNDTPNGNASDITLRSTGSGAGTAEVSVTAALAGLFSSATGNMHVSFGAPAGGTGIFGL